MTGIARSAMSTYQRVSPSVFAVAIRFIALAFASLFASTSLADVKPGAAEAKDAPKYEITINTENLSPAMKTWAEETLRPVCEEWYPKIVAMLPSEGYAAPLKFEIVFKDDMGGTPAAAAGTRVMCN